VEVDVEVDVEDINLPRSRGILAEAELLGVFRLFLGACFPFQSRFVDLVNLVTNREVFIGIVGNYSVSDSC